MQDRKHNTRFPLGWFAGIAGIILLVGSVTALVAKYSLEETGKVPVANPPQTSVEATPVTPTTKPVTEHQERVRIAWLDTAGTNIRVAEKVVTFPKSVGKEQILVAAFEQLLTAPSKTVDYTTAIPDGTKLLSLKTTEEGVRVDLSQEFLIGGGSSAMSSRLAQVIYTASSIDRNTPIWISVEGKPVTNLGGEGITISQPMTRQEFETNFEL